MKHLFNLVVCLAALLTSAAEVHAENFDVIGTPGTDIATQQPVPDVESKVFDAQPTDEYDVKYTVRYMIYGETELEAQTVTSINPNLMAAIYNAPPYYNFSHHEHNESISPAPGHVDDFSHFEWVEAVFRKKVNGQSQTVKTVRHFIQSN